jgi:hypothetical protein
MQSVSRILRRCSSTHVHRALIANVLASCQRDGDFDTRGGSGLCSRCQDLQPDPTLARHLRGPNGHRAGADSPGQCARLRCEAPWTLAHNRYHTRTLDCHLLTDPRAIRSAASSKPSLDLAAPWETRPANAPVRSCRTRSTPVLPPVAPCRTVLVCQNPKPNSSGQRPLGRPIPFNLSCLYKYIPTHENAADMARATAATCNLSEESQSTRVIIIVSIFFAGTAVFVMLRTWSKLLTRTLFAEDHIITLAVTLAMAPFVCILYSKWIFLFGLFVEA